MFVLAVVLGLLAIPCSVGVGWYLRGVNGWCPHCGDALACTCCGERPSWSTGRSLTRSTSTARTARGTRRVSLPDGLAIPRQRNGQVAGFGSPDFGHDG
jgi:hypothetical protein